MARKKKKKEENAASLDRKSIKHRSKVSKVKLKRVGFLSLIGLVIYAALTVYVLFTVEEPLLFNTSGFMSAVLISFLFGLIDKSTGLGFGTSLSPLLLVMGYEPLMIIPVLLICESVNGVISGFIHNEFDNYNLKFRPINDDTKTVLIFIACGVIGVSLSIVVTYYFFSTPTWLIKGFVALLIIGMAIVSIFKSRMEKKIGKKKPEFKKLWFFGLLAGINKGVSGGGYGPTVTLGQLISGVHPKSAVAMVSLAEGVISFIGILTFIGISFGGVQMNLSLLPAIFLGSLIGSIISPYLVRVIPGMVWRIAIPIYAIGIGVFLLIRLWIG